MSKRLKMLAIYQQCRTWGHAWEDYVPGVGERKPAPYGRGFSLRCVRCATERHDCFDIAGRLNSRGYDYPSGYQVAADERPNIEQLRISLIAEMRAQNAEIVEKRSERRRPARAAARTPRRKQRHLEAVS